MQPDRVGKCTPKILLRMKREVRLLLATFLLMGSAPAWGDTCLRTGQVTGTVCRGVGIEICDQVNLVAAEGEGGRAYTIADSFSSVSEFSESRRRCWINLKSSGLGLLSHGINFFSAEFFYRDEQGYLQAVSPDSISFPCRRVK